jgi:hypothetical protein
MLVSLIGAGPSPQAAAAPLLSALQLAPAAQALPGVAAPLNLSAWSGAGVATWAGLAAAAATSGTYTLASAFSMDGYSNGSNQIYLATGHTVTVVGQGATLDASNKGRFFNIDIGASLTLKNMTLHHGATVS